MKFRSHCKKSIYKHICTGVGHISIHICIYKYMYICNAKSMVIFHFGKYNEFVALSINQALIYPLYKWHQAAGIWESCDLGILTYARLRREVQKEDTCCD